MTKTRTTRRRTYSYRPTRRRSTAVSRAKRATHRRAKVIKLWRNRLIAVAIIILAIPIAARLYIHYSVRDQVYPNVYDVPQCRVALVLGAGVRPDGSLTPSLASRVDKAVELWREGKVDKLLMSGDNRVTHYNEPERMRQYAMKRGVPREAIAADYAGRRTYDSTWRAKNIFGLRKVIVVTQSFHLDRALFLCNHVGLKAYGVGTTVTKDFRATVREMPACVGALADVYIRHPHPVGGKKEKI